MNSTLDQSDGKKKVWWNKLISHDPKQTVPVNQREASGMARTGSLVFSDNVTANDSKIIHYEVNSNICSESKKMPQNSLDSASP